MAFGNFHWTVIPTVQPEGSQLRVFGTLLPPVPKIMSLIHEIHELAWEEEIIFFIFTSLQMKYTTLLNHEGIYVDVW